MAKHGGKREGAGRKPRADEELLIEQLDKIIDKDEAINVLHNLMVQGDMKAITLWFNYRFGKPKETKDIKVELDNNFPDWLDEQG